MKLKSVISKICIISFLAITCSNAQTPARYLVKTDSLKNKSKQANSPESEKTKDTMFHNDNLAAKINAEQIQIDKEKTEIYLLLFVSLTGILLIAVLFYRKLVREKTKNNLALEEKVKARTEELLSKNIQLGGEISSRKRAEEIIAESEEKYKSLFNDNHSVMLLIDHGTGNIVDANSAACGYYGWAHKEITSKNIAEINTLSPDEIYSAMNEAKANYRKAFNFRHRLADSSIRDVEVFSGPITIGGKKLLYSIVHDITEKLVIESALKDSEGKYRNLVEDAMVGVLRTKINGEILFANNAVALMLEYKNPGDVISSGMPVMYKDAGQREDLLERLKKDGRVENFEMTVITRTGKEKIFLMNTVLNGDIIDGILVDITERIKIEKELLESENCLTRAEKVAKTGNWKILLNSKLVMSSIGARLIYGVDKEIMPLEEIMNIALSEYRPLLDKAYSDLVTKNIPYNVEFKIRRPNDNKIVDVHSMADYDKENNILFGIVQDITERKQAEEEIREKNEELLKLNSEKDKFFSIIAHDLKSPFQGLMGYTEILTKEYNVLSEAEKVSFINSIAALSLSSYKLLENLLDWSGMQTGRMIFTPEKFNLVIELYHTLSLLKQTALNKSIEFCTEIDNSIFITADRNMLSTIIRNLVSNAIKFTNHKGKITLRAIKKNRNIEFSVSDTGVGIEKENLDKIFLLAGNKSSKGTAEETGSGLGLMLCKEMVEQHGGKIWVESRVNKGSTFYFTIPE
jgi:PAS domain S-box-containing protein